MSSAIGVPSMRDARKLYQLAFSLRKDAAVRKQTLR